MASEVINLDMALTLNDVIGSIVILMVIATIEAAVTFVTSFKCTKLYMSCAPDSGITDFVKKTIFMVFMLCNCLSMLTSVLAVIILFWAKLLSNSLLKAVLCLQALYLVKLSSEYMLIAFSLGVYVMVMATIEAAVTIIMGFTCTEVYMSSVTDSGIVKKTIFMVFLLCKWVPMLASVVAVMALFWAKLLNDITEKASLFGYAMKLVKVAFVSMLVAFIVGLVVMILLPCHVHISLI
ncbi:unnamed protein product [Thlaspi arvense]|uniref:PGG domain-containing protein n=1 Tax=Thlaspi arvense TaxID=13288 RepID=A0AAU9S1L8_THLAR|nr:unnamed protein product [Thlaspi arvense]